MGKLLDTVSGWLKEDAWKFEIHEEKNVVKTGVKGESASYTLVFRVNEERQTVVLYVMSPNGVGEEKRMAVSEYLTRANYGLSIGNFEMDFDDGEVRYKVSVDVEGSELTAKMVQNMILAGVTTMDHYYTGMMAIVYGKESPINAISKIEG